ncbi:hypothetical protein TSPI_07212 [Trichinella spiralis]|uniref:Uncharacterized protein n=1 Tax=Trichinella spiralis TaxID=6334 RepID=A0ABR3KIW2_TRISP
MRVRAISHLHCQLPAARKLDLKYPCAYVLGQLLCFGLIGKLLSLCCILIFFCHYLLACLLLLLLLLVVWLAAWLIGGAAAACAEPHL